MKLRMHIQSHQESLEVASVVSSVNAALAALMSIPALNDNGALKEAISQIGRIQEAEPSAHNAFPNINNQAVFPPPALPTPNMPLQASSFNPGCSDRWLTLRHANPPPDPATLFHESCTLGWKPESPPGTSEPVWSSLVSQTSKDEQLWGFWNALAKCGFYVDDYYNSTEHSDNVNSYAGGTEAVPCVRGKTLKITVNWFASRDGRLRVDGVAKFNDIAMEMLRRGFAPYLPGATAQGDRTGQQANPLQVATRKKEIEEAARVKWEKERRNQVLMLGASEAFSSFGETGIWDTLNGTAGVNNIPASTSTPWSIVVNAGACVLVYPDGRTSVQLGSSSVAAARDVEQVLIAKFNGRWISEKQYRADAIFSQTRIRFGMKGQRAREQEEGRLFRSG